MENDKSKNVEKHFTASAFVFNKDDKVLIIFHERADTWLPPGGHIEPNENPIEAAKREVLEETGYKIKILPDKFHGSSHMLYLPVTVSEHSVGDHFHVDFNYAAVLEDTRKAKSEELEEKWVTLEEAKPLMLPGVYERLEKAFLAYQKYRNL